ncbi:MAG TPA: sigma 54-interacting transcriptional regulator [Kofleriaceae bacterium]|nr:sigma 54-interacting transcriptional regulator [Kofleriaceae bacterium]
MPGDLRELTERLGQALPEDERAGVEAQLGRRFRDAGEPEQALRYLSAARRRYTELADARGAAAIDVDLAEVCASRGEHDRALTFLDRALDHAETIGDDELRAQVQLLLGESALARGDLDGARDLLVAARAHWDEYWNGAALARSAASLARTLARRGELAEAQVFIDLARGDARPIDDAALTSRVAMAAGELAERSGDTSTAVSAYRAAIEAASAGGARRALAEAHLAMGLVLGVLTERDAAPEPPAGHLAQAQELFRATGGMHDLERVREAFRRFGRRATDRAEAAELAPLLAELRDHRRSVQEAAGRLHDLTARGPAAAGLELRAVEATVTSSLRDLTLAEDRFVAAVNAVVVDRENIRGLLDMVRQLAQTSGFEAMTSEVATLACHLVTADRVVVDIAGTPRSAIGVDLATSGPWNDALDTARSAAGRPMLVAAPGPAGRASGRRTTTKLGAAMVVPLRAGGGRVVGAVWVDKEPSGGVFSERDLDLLTVFAAQVATVVENARIADELRFTARTTAATLEAISDGVVAIDASGGVTAMNTTAARLLGVVSAAGTSPGREPSLGKRVFELASPDGRAVLTLLTDAAARADELDGRTVTLGSADFLVTTRLIRDDHGLAVGLVATLTELKRASSLAQRMVGTSARYVLGDLVGRSPALRHVLGLAEAAAQSDAAVLISGESGTGKEVLAQAIHNASGRASGPFVAVNCAAIPRDLLESELFGYEAGAFTGARKGGRPGKFEIAEGGTLLLDEIGDMPIDMQVKLLRVLQEKTVSRLGGARELPVSCRIVATTNRDLDDEAQRGLFRRDLYYRLRVINIELPPLRERKGDIAALVDHFLRVYAGRAGKRLTRIAASVMDALVAYPWPGNIRELEHVLESEVALAAPDATTISEIPMTLRERPRRSASPTTPPSMPAVPMHVMPMMPTLPTVPLGPALPSFAGTATPPYGHALPMAYAPGTMASASTGIPSGAFASPNTPPGAIRAVVDVERDLLVAALTRYRGRIPAVARALGWSRGTIYNKMRKYQLEPDQFRDLP